MVDYEKIKKVIREEVEKESAIADEMAYKRGYIKGKADYEEDLDKTSVLELYAEGYLDGLENMIDAVFDIFQMNYFERQEKFGATDVADILDENHPLDILKIIEEDKEDEPKEATPEETKELIEKLEKSDLDEDFKRAMIDYVKTNKMVVVKL